MQPKAARDRMIRIAVGLAPGMPVARLIVRFIAGDSNGELSNPYCGVLLGSLLDAGLYLGQPGDLTASWPNPAI
jgi:hypothetical protein